MSENVKQSLTYSLGIIHGTRNVLKRILKGINEMDPVAGGNAIGNFAGLFTSINETDIIRENGKFIINANGDIEFDWIPEKRDAIAHLIKTEG